MKLLLPPALTLVVLCSLTSCSKDFSCKSLQKGEWAIEIFDDLGEDGDCPYEGTAILNGEELELSCEVSGKQCVCNAGHEFGIYDVTFTNTETGETDRAQIKVEPAPEPICLVRDAIGRSPPPTGDGGAGGDGGADN